MQKKTGVHFYINIANFDDVAEKEEAATQEVKHSIHELDTFFSSVEAYGLKHYPGLFRVEKITGSRLHMYVENDSVPKTFEIVAAVTKYAFELAGHLNVNVSKYKTLLPFCIHAGACYGPFYEFEFKRKDADEMTTIGFAANYAAKLQNMENLSRVLISENIYDSLTADQKKCFSRLTPTAIRKYNQTCCYDAEIANLPVRYNFKRDFERAVEIARKVDLQNMYFRSANQPLSYRNLSKTECKKINGIPLFADVRDFTSQFDEDGANLEEMAVKTQNILTAMYDVVEERNGIHVQFQGDREMALFHDYGDYSCVVDAVIAGLKIIDAVKEYQVSVGVGQSIGRLFAAKIGARGEKDNILLGRTVGEADKNEDEYAEKNQLVLSADLYEKLKQNDSGLSSLFKKKNGGVYYTESGYHGYLSQESRKQLKHDNAHNNYNKAWGVFVD